MKDKQSQQTAMVSEDKFNGTATLNVSLPADTDEPKRIAKTLADRYFKNVHGSSPSKKVAERFESAVGEDSIQYTVMVADHSSGSLNDSQEYDI